MRFVAVAAVIIGLLAACATDPVTGRITAVRYTEIDGEPTLHLGLAEACGRNPRLGQLDEGDDEIGIVIEIDAPGEDQQLCLVEAFPVTLADELGGQVVVDLSTGARFVPKIGG